MKLALALLSVAASALADSAHSPLKRVHHAHVARDMGLKSEIQDLSKRESFTGTATWYDVTTAAGACGDWMTPDQSVVALNSAQLQAYGGYQNGKPSSCYKSITIQANGQTHNAVIMDECPTCDWGFLDLSQGLFQSFSDLGAGVFPITWWFNDGTTTPPASGGGSTNNDNNNNNNNNNQQSSSQDQPTTTQPPPDTSTSSTPSSTPTPTSTSTSTSDSSSSTESLSVQSVPTTTEYQNLYAAPKAVVQLAAFLHAAVGH